MRNNFKGSIILLITAVIWGTAFVVQSTAMDNIGPLLFMTVRFFLAGLVLLPVINFISRMKVKGGSVTRREQAVITKNSVKGGICCGVFLAMGAGFQQYGILTTTAGKAGFITALYIVMVPVLGLFLGKKVPKRVWVSVAVALTGFYFLSIQGGFTIVAGDILMVIGAVGFALQITCVDHFLLKGLDPVTLSSAQFFTVSAIFVIPMFLFEGFNLSLISAAGFNIFYTGVISGGVAYTLQIVGQKYTEPTLATLIMSLESVVAALSGWLLLGETLSPREFFGCVLVFGAVLLAQIQVKGQKQ